MKYKNCPYCREEIFADARKCRYCGEFLEVNVKRDGLLTAIKYLLPMIAIGYCFSLLEKEPIREESDETSTSVNAQPDEMKVSGITTHIAFSNPNRICNILTDQGLNPSDPATGGKWEYIDPIGYSCQAELEVTPGYYKFVGDVPNVIEFWVESESADIVERFQIKANVFNEKRGKPVMEKFLTLTKLLFSRLELTMPESLLAAINDKKMENFITDYGNIIVKYETYNIGHGLTVEVNANSSFKVK